MATTEEGLVYEAVIEKDGLKVSKSPWGPDDEIGRLNWLTQDAVKTILDRLDGRKVFDLNVDYFVGMPSWSAAGDPKFDLWMTHTPQGSIHDNLSGVGAKVHEKYSYCGDAMTLYTHCGTHIDTLNHLGHWGCFWNGWTADTHLGSRHWTVGGTDKYPPIMARGVLLDIAGLHGVDCLDDGYAVQPQELKDAVAKQGVELRRGDVVCVRMGRMTKWPDFDGYLLAPPGIGARRRQVAVRGGRSDVHRRRHDRPRGDPVRGAGRVPPRPLVHVHDGGGADHRGREHGGARRREAVRVRLHGLPDEDPRRDGGPDALDRDPAALTFRERPRPTPANAGSAGSAS